MNPADTAWMLISTALVLLMTPILAFFYGGLVRSKNALNTMMMSFVSLGFVGVVWPVSATRSRSRPAAIISAARSGCFFGASGWSRARGRPFRTTCTCAIRARSRSSPRRSSRARSSNACASPPTSCSSPCGRSLSTARSRIGSGAAAGWPRWARWTSPAAPSSTSMPAWRRWSPPGGRPAARLPVVRAPPAQRAVHAARGGSAVVRLVRVQRRQCGRRQRDRGARVHGDHAGTGRDARGVDPDGRVP